MKLCVNSANNLTDPIKIESWSDADFAEDKSYRKSVSGSVIMMERAVVSWSCKKQTGVSLSTMEAEFIAASQAERELLGLKELFGKLGMKIVKPMPMWMDNQAAIKHGKARRAPQARNTLAFVSSLSLSQYLCGWIAKKQSSIGKREEHLKRETR